MLHNTLLPNSPEIPPRFRRVVSRLAKSCETDHLPSLNFGFGGLFGIWVWSLGFRCDLCVLNWSSALLTSPFPAIWPLPQQFVSMNICVPLMRKPMKPEVELYDTTLRDGSQGEGINFSVIDKLRIAEKLDAFGFHYIEGGWTGSNPKDIAFCP